MFPILRFTLYATCALLSCIFLAVQAQVPIATHFRAIGPLSYNSERGSDPLRAFHTPLLETLQALNSFPSESAVGGLAFWRDCLINASTPVITCPFSDADPSQSYSAWALANFTVHEDAGHPHLLQCSDPAVIRVKKLEPEYTHILKHAPDLSVTKCPQDTYNDGRSLCVVRLYPGMYEIFFETASDRNYTQFQCNYVHPLDSKPFNPLYQIDDVVTPDIMITKKPFRAILAGPHISVTVMNAHHAMWASNGAATLTNAVPGIRIASDVSNGHIPRIAPRQTRQLRIDLATDEQFLKTLSTTSIPSQFNLTFSISYEVGPSMHTSEFEVSLDVATWGVSRAYHFTFVDVDGSIQTTAVLPPANHCPHEQGCQALLSTHGAGVNAIASAWTESYRTQNTSWVILPTGRRKYGLNWEGPQMKSALTSLSRFAALLPGVPQEEKHLWRVRDDMWLQAGHSMGGHGALVLSTHFPDMLVAALPAMGWLRVSTYGGSHYREQISYSDATARALQSVASEEYASDLYAENLLGIPLLARVGSADDNVPPSNLRKFCRLLKENEFFNNIRSSFVSLNEVPGKGHWFDGVVDDEILQPFIEKHLASAMKPRLPSQFTMVTLNPASTGSRGGMRILSLEVVFQLSRLRIRRETPEPGSWTIASENVRRFRYEPVPGIIDRPIRLYIDGSKSPLLLDPSSLAASKSFVDYCSESSSELASTDSRGIAWYECADTKSWGTETSLERGPDNSGPAFQVLGQRKVVIVFPEEDHELQSSAVSYANSLYLRGISVQVTGDSEYETSAPEILGRANVILLGGPDVNRASKRFATDGFTADVEFGKDRICVGAVKCFAKPGIGVAFLSNGPKRTLLFYTAGTDRDGLMSVLSYLPHSPESNVPEWVVVSREKGWGFRGLGGVIGLGYFDRRWKFEPRKSYPAEFIFDVKQSGVTCATRRAKHFALTWSGGIIALFVGILVLVLGMSVVVVRRRREARASRYEEVQSDETAASLGPAIEKSMKHEERCLMEEEHVS